MGNPMEITIQSLETMIAPLGKRLQNTMGSITMLFMGKLTISMAVLR